MFPIYWLSRQAVLCKNVFTTEFDPSRHHAPVGISGSGSGSWIRADTTPQWASVEVGVEVGSEQTPRPSGHQWKWEWKLDPSRHHAPVGISGSGSGSWIRADTTPQWASVEVGVEVGSEQTPRPSGHQWK